MTRKLLASLFILSTVLFACTQNAITGRNQLSLVSEQQVEQEAQLQYKQFLSQNKVVSNYSNKDAEMVKRVGSRIENAINQYYKQKG